MSQQSDQLQAQHLSQTDLATQPERPREQLGQEQVGQQLALPGQQPEQPEQQPETLERPAQSGQQPEPHEQPAPSNQPERPREQLGQLPQSSQLAPTEQPTKLKQTLPQLELSLDRPLINVPTDPLFAFLSNHGFALVDESGHNSVNHYFCGTGRGPHYIGGTTWKLVDILVRTHVTVSTVYLAGMKVQAKHAECFIIAVGERYRGQHSGPILWVVPWQEWQRTSPQPQLPDPIDADEHSITFSDNVQSILVSLTSADKNRMEQSFELWQQQEEPLHSLNQPADCEEEPSHSPNHTPDSSGPTSHHSIATRLRQKAAAQPRSSKGIELDYSKEDDSEYASRPARQKVRKATAKRKRERQENHEDENAELETSKHKLSSDIVSLQQEVAHLRHELNAVTAEKSTMKRGDPTPKKSVLEPSSPVVDTGDEGSHHQHHHHHHHHHYHDYDYDYDHGDEVRAVQELSRDQNAVWGQVSCFGGCAPGSAPHAP